MSSSRREPLGTAKRLGKSFTFLGRDGAFELDEVFGFFLLGVGGQIVHEDRQRGNEAGIGGFETLEDLELFFNLMGERSVEILIQK